MHFYNYMIRKYKGTGTPEKDLANIMRADKERFPRNKLHKMDGWHNLIREHIEKRDDYAGYIGVFERCWEDYLRCEKKK